MSEGETPVSRTAGSKPRVLVLSSTFPRYADDPDPPFVFELCRRLAAHFEIDVLAPHAPGLPTTDSMAGVTVYRFRYFFENGQSLAYAGGILSGLRQEPLRWGLVPPFIGAEWLACLGRLRSGAYDLVHAHWLLPQGLTALLARGAARRRVPCVCTCHGGDLYALRGALATRLKRWSLRRLDRVAVVSQAMASEAIRAGADTRKVRVMPMGADLVERFTPPDGEHRNPELLFVGRLVEKKGLTHLVDALPEILKSHPRATLTVAGTGPAESALRRQVQSLGLAAQVRMLGAVENRDLPALYQRAAVVVFPSVIARDGDREGLGLVPVEALGCGCAVVASDLPAIRDVVQDGVAGLLVAPGDSAALATGIKRLLADPVLRTTLAARGRQHVLGRYDWQTVTARYCALYEEMLDCR